MIQPKLIRYEMTELGSNFEVRPNFGDPNCHVWLLATLPTFLLLLSPAQPILSAVLLLSRRDSQQATHSWRLLNRFWVRQQEQRRPQAVQAKLCRVPLLPSRWMMLTGNRKSQECLLQKKEETSQVLRQKRLKREVIVYLSTFEIYSSF